MPISVYVSVQVCLCVSISVRVRLCLCLCVQLTVIRLVMRDTIEQELYQRNNERDIAEVSLNFTTSSSNQHGVEVSVSSVQLCTENLNYTTCSIL